MTNMVKPGHRIPEATVARLPVYLRSLFEVVEEKTTTISSERLADMAGVNAAKVRKDLSYLGSYGTRGVGYDVQYLLLQISRQLGLNQDRPVVIVGVGNLGHALANYRGFLARGFRVMALFDADLTKVGERIGDLQIRSMDDLDEVVRGENATIGVITTPEKVAQEVADRLVAAGVTSILNFAPSVLTVPPHVSLRKVDLSIELQILSFYQQRAGTGTLPAADLPGPDLRGAELPGPDRRGAELPGPDRRGAELPGPDRRGPGSALAGQSG
jgi:redox-sensing transcriptional repressor